MKNNPKQNTTMKKKIISLIAIFSLMIGPLNAQIFITENEEEIFNPRVNPEGLSPGWFVIPDMPNSDSALDYTPIGDGLWALGLLGGAYLLGKRRKKKEE